MKEICFLLLLSYASCCGQLTHSDTLVRAYKMFPINKRLEPYKDIINAHLPFLQAGVVFPDLGYTIGDYSDAAEYAHWPPFIADMINHMAEKYEKGSEEHDRLLVFTLGVTLHYETDVLWHFGLEASTHAEDLSGFLRAMTQEGSICEGSWNSSRFNPSCHNVGDIGGDFIVSNRRETFNLESSWSFPLGDVDTVFKAKEQYFPMHGMILLAVGDFLVDKITKIGGYPGLTFLEKNTSFLTEEFDLYYQGGLDDMAFGTVMKWERLLLDYESGEYRSYSFKQPVKRRRRRKPTIPEKYFNTLVDKFNVKHKLIKGILTIYANNPTGTELPKYFRTDDPSLKGNYNYGYFGLSMVEGDFGTGKQILVGEPGYGRLQSGAVYDVTSGSKKLILEGKHMTAKFGYSMAVFDYDKDGIDDLAVSAPLETKIDFSVNFDEYYPREYEGRVYIYRGSEQGLITEEPFKVVKYIKPSAIEVLGSELFSADCDGDGFRDLIIGSPQASVNSDKQGRVSVLLKRPTTEILEIERDFENFLGRDEYAQFGYSVTCHKNTLIVGAPGDKIKRSVSGSGAVFGIDVASKKQLFEVEAKTQMARFGKSLTVFNGYLVVGAPSLNNTNWIISKYQGAVFVYSLKELALKSMIAAETEYYKKIYSLNDRSRFGSSLLYSKGYLFVGAPQFSNDEGYEEGKIFKISFESLKKDNIDMKVGASRKGKVRNGRLGFKLLETHMGLIASGPFGMHQSGYIEKLTEKASKEIQ